jgi:N-formylglutamate amidohydrolase
MGVVYERTSTGRWLREGPAAAEREGLLRRFYHPHHEAFAAAVAERLETSGACLVIDCHSFPSRARAFELDPEAPRPDINLGTDAFHTPTDLIARATAAFEEQGFSVQVDSPYKGTLVPTRYFRADARVRSVMVEVNRRLYLDEQTGHPLPGFDAVSARIRASLEAFA